MASYPSFTQLGTSTWVRRDDVKTDFAVNGTLQQRALYDTPKMDFTVRHLLVAADAVTLRTFRETNRLLVVTFVWSLDGNTYNVRFRGPLRESWSNGLWSVEADLSEV